MEKKMNKTKLFLALFSLLGPVTVTQVKALPAPEAPVNEQSIRARIQKIEADIKELGQLPSLKDEATQLLADIQKWNTESSKKPIEEKVPGAPGRNNVMARKSFSDHLTNIENRFKHPKETATQIQKTLSEVAAQIESYQNPAVKSALSVILQPIKQKVDSLTSPVSEIEGLIAKIKTELPADSGQKEHPNGFKPNKHPDGIIIPDTHPNGIIIPGDNKEKLALDELPKQDASVTPDIVTAISAAWTTAKTEIGDKKLLSKQFPQVTDTNVTDFSKAYNEQFTLISTLKNLITGQFKTQYNATKNNEISNAWVKEVAQKLYEFIVMLRTDLTKIEPPKTLLATSSIQLKEVPALEDLEKMLGAGNQDIEDKVDIFGIKVTKKNAKTALLDIAKKINDAKSQLAPKDADIKTALDTISAKPETEKSATKTDLSKFETTYNKAISTLKSISAGINNVLPKITGNSGIKKSAGKDAVDALNNAVNAFKTLTTFEIFKPGQTTGKGKNVKTEPSKYEALKNKLK